MAAIIVHVVGDNTVLYTVLGTLGGVALGGLATWLLQRSKINADREHVELEALRKVLDEGGEALAHGILTASRSANLWRQALPDNDPSKEDAEVKQRETAALAYSVYNRLALRLAAGDLVLGRYLEAAEALNAISAFLTDNAEQDNYAAEEQAFKQRLGELETCIMNFLLTAQKRYGPKIKSPSTLVPYEE
jgi:hypothetical protein